MQVAASQSALHDCYIVSEAQRKERIVNN